MSLCHTTSFIWVNSSTAGYTALHTLVHTHTHSEKGGITQVLISESLVSPCSCGQHTRTLFNPNIFGRAVHTHPFTATIMVIQHDTNLLITLDDHDIGLEGKLRSECANLPTKGVYLCVCLSVCTQAALGWGLSMIHPLLSHCHPRPFQLFWIFLSLFFSHYVSLALSL